MKSYKIKSSVTRALKAQGIDASTGTIEQNEKGEFYFQETAHVEGHKAQLETMAANSKSAAAKPVAEEISHLKASTIDSPCKVVWDIAESMPGARRKDVIAACEKAGIAFYTARTQYQQWRKAVQATIECGGGTVATPASQK